MDQGTRPCKDCGETGGLGWWVGRFSHPGAAGPRCHECYLTYTRRRQNAANKGRTRPPGRNRQRKPPTGATVDCVICTKSFRRTSSQRSCSPDCAAELARERNRRKNRKRRNARRGNAHEPYTLAEIALRDGCRCHLCGFKVNMAIDGMAPKGPTIDHLIPISADGPDVKSNVALAHRICNVRRGNAGMAQLRLTG